MGDDGDDDDDDDGPFSIISEACLTPLNDSWSSPLTKLLI